MEGVLAAFADVRQRRALARARTRSSQITLRKHHQAIDPIIEGRVDASTLTFKVRTADKARMFTFTGQVNGDELRFTRAVEIITPTPAAPPSILGATGPSTLTAKRLPTS